MLLQINILLVDDDQDLLNLVEKYLMRKHPDIVVTTVVSAQEALQMLEESSFDAVVCDYYLGPGQMNGLELLEWLRGGSNNTPFVMFTGRSREEVAIRALNLGADFYLKKDQHDFAGLFTELVHHLRRAVESRQMEFALSQSEARYRTLFDDSPISLWEEDFSKIKSMIDDKREEGVSDFREYFRRNPDFAAECIENIRVVSVNKSTLKMFGAHDLDLLVSGFGQTLTADGHSVLQNELIALTEGNRSYEGEISALTLIGAEIKLQFSMFIAPGHEENWSKILVAITDITEERASQRALKDSEEQYRSLFENTPTGIAYHRILMDDDGKPFDYIFLDVNDAFTELTGLQKESTINQPVSKVIPTLVEDEFDWVGKYGRVAITGEVVQFEQFAEALDCWFSVVAYSPAKYHFVTVFTDVTKRKQAELALRESEHQYRSTLYSLSDSIHVIDRDFKIILLNPAFESWLLELNMDIDPLGRKLFDAFPFLPKTVQEEYETVFKNGKILSTIENTVIGESEIITETRKIPVIRDEKVYQIVTKIRDITASKIAEENLKESQRF
ncbi:MAG: response regulator, partial [Candidatus Thorarchaeota archaeon]